MQLHFTITVLLLTFLSFGNAWGGGDKVKLKDVSTLTLYHGKMTTARRSHPVPQLNCVGGSAGCSAFVSRVVQCYNKGWDGNDVQWKCETDMDNAYRFGSVEVSCEGYDYPEDPYVLKGSCGLEYTIDLTKEGTAQQTGHNYYGGNDHGNKYATHTSKKSSPFGDIILLGVVALVIYALYKTCLSQQVTTGDDTGDGHGPGGPRRRGWFNSWFGGGGSGYGNQAPPPGFRPEYYGTGDPGCGSTGGHSATGGGGGGGGFWTGAATGGLLGYMFGNRMAGDNTYQRRAYPATRGGGWFQSGSTNSSYASTSTASSPSTGTRTASGFGGTKRR